jgi:thiamine pyrophosphate-dependent acetolactate synthase large subunit-like protein
MGLSKSSGAFRVVQTLEKLGVDTIFGIPGAHNLDVYEALLESEINHVTGKNESGVGFMADGYARVSGKPGVAFVITGPGLTNILTPMGQAYHDSVPMLVISSQIPSNIIDQDTGFLHELKNSTIMAKSVAKESRTVIAPEQIETYIEEAYYLTTSGRPGPVHVEIPMDIFKEICNESSDEILIKLNSNIKPNINKEVLAAIAKEMNQSKKVAMIVGGGACEASEEVKLLAEKADIPVIQSYAGKGVLDEKHPLCIGTRIQFDETLAMLKECDVVLAIGTQLSATDLWEKPLRLQGKLLQIDTDAGAFNKNYPADIGLKADTKEALGALIPLIEDKENKEICQIVSKLVKAGKDSVSELSGIVDTFDQAMDMLDTIRETLSEDGVLLADMTTSAYLAISEYPVSKPRTFLHPIGFGTLGYSVPAAIGAKMKYPDKDMIALIGDGGFQFTMQELSVACKLKLNLPIIIWNNDGYGEIRRYERARNFKENISVDHIAPDLVKLADAYGISGVRPKTKEELAEAIRSSLLKEEPTIIEIHIENWRK